jgi:hypothetical protein
VRAFGFDIIGETKSKDLDNILSGVQELLLYRNAGKHRDTIRSGIRFVKEKRGP